MAQSAPSPQGDSAPICADRPGKGTATCTAPAGHWQVEVDAVDLTHGRSGDADVFAAANVKYGLSERLDGELTFTPWETSRGGSGPNAQGFGDLVVRSKLALVTSGDNTIALDPYLKIPTASNGLGNNAYEGGIVAPVAWTLPDQFSLALTPELDWLKNGSDGGRHLAYSATLGLGRALTSELTGGVELWGAVNADPAGQTRQASFDLTLAFIPAKAQWLQIDGGINLGLNSDTPQTQVYVGVSRRF